MPGQNLAHCNSLKWLHHQEPNEGCPAPPGAEGGGGAPPAAARSVRILAARSARLSLGAGGGGPGAPALGAGGGGPGAAVLDAGGPGGGGPDGVFAAIPAVLAYNRFAGRVDYLLNRYDTFVDEFSGILQRQTYALRARQPRD